MRDIEDITKDIEPLEWIGPKHVEVLGMEYDSRAIGAGSCFFALNGAISDGHNYIEAAVAAGAVAVICERMPQSIKPEVSYIRVADSHQAMGLIAAAYWGNPSSKLKLVGITGTNGKTTTATLLYELFRALGFRVGLISTVNYRIDDKIFESTHTTPDSLRLQEMLHQMVQSGCHYCFMEVSSHAVVQRRIAGAQFAGALFSNITHDHLDYHGTFAEYIKAKKGLFDSLDKGAFALTNIDDRNGSVMLQNCKAQHFTYSQRSMADFRCKIVEMHLDSMLLRIDGLESWVNFTGRFNAYNALAIYSVARCMDIEPTEILMALSSLRAVCGRFETIGLPNGATAIIDYAHTPDALLSVLSTVSEIITAEQKIIAVCGCGGDRDRAKRPEMARIATENSSLTIFTSDNPRSESPEAIIEQMKAGIKDPVARYLSIVDRAEAIRTALLFAAQGDVVVIAGKGHEQYQIIGEQKHHFSDHEVVAEMIKNKN